jgi:hypothetical protein
VTTDAIRRTRRPGRLPARLVTSQQSVRHPCPATPLSHNGRKRLRAALRRRGTASLIHPSTADQLLHFRVRVIRQGAGRRRTHRS